VGGRAFLDSGASPRRFLNSNPTAFTGDYTKVPAAGHWHRPNSETPTAVQMRITYYMLLEVTANESIDDTVLLALV
jgi:hypothetical protein